MSNIKISNQMILICKVIFSLFLLIYVWNAGFFLLRVSACYAELGDSFKISPVSQWYVIADGASTLSAFLELHGNAAICDALKFSNVTAFLSSGFWVQMSCREIPIKSIQ